MSRLKLDGIQELEDSPQTAATELNDKEINPKVLTVRTWPEMNNFLFLSSKQNITHTESWRRTVYKIFRNHYQKPDMWFLPLQIKYEGYYVKLFVRSELP